MINIATITRAVADQLRNNTGVMGLVQDPARVVRAEYVNRDPANTPWLGVYRQPIDFDAKTLGNSTGSWQTESSVVIVCQAHADGGEAAEDVLGELVEKVLDAVRADLSFGGTVGTVRSLRVEWMYQKTDSETLDFQEANVVINFETRAP